MYQLPIATIIPRKNLKISEVYSKHLLSFMGLLVSWSLASGCKNALGLFYMPCSESHSYSWLCSHVGGRSTREDIQLWNCIYTSSDIKWISLYRGHSLCSFTFTYRYLGEKTTLKVNIVWFTNKRLTLWIKVKFSKIF